jgi:CTP:molybdopterin cytidylyltransferase MocA
MRSACLLLAAGKSERTMPIPKGLILVEGIPRILYQCQQIEKILGNELLIVLGYHEEKYRNVIGYKYATIINPDPERGQFSSIQTGLAALSDREAVFILPIDEPCPDASVWKALEKNLPERGVAIPQINEKGGHPALVSASLIPEILSLDPERDRLDHFIHRLDPKKVVRV